MIILDPSAGIQMALGSPEGEKLKNLLLQGEKKLASAMYPVEVANGFWKYVHAGRMNEALAKELIARTNAIPDALVPLSENLDEAFAAACRYNHSIYDMFYLTLARRYDAVLYTLDRRLQQVCTRAGVNCVQLIDLPPGE